MWKYKFNVQLEDRDFNLACRTVNELENWIRVFSLLLKMKKVNVGLTTVNPFVFEKQHLKGEMIENQIVKKYKT